MENIYINQINELQEVYSNTTKKILDDFKKEVAPDRLGVYTDAVKLQIKEDAKQECIDRLNHVKEKYCVKAQQLIDKPLDIPKAKINSESDLHKMELRLLANKDRDNISELKGTMNTEDFMLIKGQLIKNAILTGNKDLVAEINKIYPINEEELRLFANNNLTQKKLNANYVIGLDPATQVLISSKSLSGYLDEIANLKINYFE